MQDKIKVSAPKTNPHICYIPEEYREQIEAVKKATRLSLWALLCKVSNRKLDTKENIKSFKTELKKQGYKTIGDWATDLIILLYDNLGMIDQIDLSTIKLKHKEK